VHALVLALVCWAASGTYEALLPVPVLHTSRLYAVRYLILTDPEPMAGVLPASESSAPQRPQARATTPAASTIASGKTAVGNGPPSRPEPAPRNWSNSTALDADRSSTQSLAPLSSAAPANDVQELQPGEVAGIGQVTSAGPNTNAEAGILNRLGFRPPTPEEVGASKRGDDRVAELVTGTSSACPALESPAAWPRPTLVVSVSFMVDSSGVVDRRSIRVVESPGHPQSDRRYHAHVFVVAATMSPGAGSMTADRYDSLVTSELRSHAADLTFRPALEDGQPVQSSVLISCQMLQPG
jgi:hypothetical protein